MKRLGNVLAAMVMLLTMFAGLAVDAVALNLINNSHDELNLINAIANVQRVNGADAQTVLSADSKPGIALVKVSELADVTAFLKLCMEQNVIPTLQVESASEVSAVAQAMTTAACKDVNVISTQAPLIGNMRRQKAIVRTGLILDLESAQLSSDQANEIRMTVRNAPATFCVLNSADASYQVVSELQELAVAVWVEVASPVGGDEFKVEALRAVTSGANGIISVSAAELTKLINDSLEEKTMTRTPIMIGHRGNPSQAPENSLSGFIAAYQNGADVFEVDVEITRDGEIVIMHDSTLNRTTNYDGNKSVNQMTLAEIKEYYLLDGKTVTQEKVPTLREVLEEFKDKDCRIFVEFKGSNAKNVPATISLIKEYGMEDRVDVISFSAAFLQQTQNLLPGMSTGYLHSPSQAAGNTTTALEALYMSIGNTQSIKSSLNPNKVVGTSYYVQAATDRGMTVWPWTYNLGSNNSAFFVCPDGITTDDVQWVKDMYKYMEATVPQPSVAPGAAMEMTVNAVTYGGATTALSADQMIVQVLSGADCITLDGTTVTGVKDGTATVMFGYKTKTTNGTEYVLYAQPVTVTVATTTLPAANADLVMIVVAVVLVALAVAAVVVVVIVALKSRKPKAE